MRLTPMLIYIVPVIVVILGVAIWLQPEWVISRLRHSSPEVLYSVETEESILALTIDDGPDPETSPLILDLLRRYNAKATFFLITDHIPGNESLIHRMISEGHEIGNHLTEDEPSIRMPIDEFAAKMIKADRVLSEYSEIHWIRPGSGWYNDEMLAVISNHDYKCALGSIYPYDPQIGSSWFSSRYVLWKASPGDIIVLHDYRARGRRTAKALESLLPELDRRGYKIVTLSELSALENGNNP